VSAVFCVASPGMASNLEHEMRACCHIHKSSGNWGVLIKTEFLLRGNNWLRLKIALPTLRPDIFDG
jgi:hypothetical protein